MISYEKNKAIQSHLDKAKAICLTAESIVGEQGCEFIPVTSAADDFNLSFVDRRSFAKNHLSGKGLVTMVLAAGRRAENGVYNRQYRFDQRQMVHYL